MTYAGNSDSPAEAAESPRHIFERVDIVNAAAVWLAFEQYMPSAVIHLAAEPHVDRAIHGPGRFIRTDVVGTFTLLADKAPSIQGLCPLLIAFANGSFRRQRTRGPTWYP